MAPIGGASTPFQAEIIQSYKCRRAGTIALHRRKNTVRGQSASAKRRGQMGVVIQAVSMLNDNTGQITYGTVPGYPEKNCPRCRWVSLPVRLFWPGLQSHWR